MTHTLTVCCRQTSPPAELPYIAEQGGGKDILRRASGGDSSVTLTLLRLMCGFVCHMQLLGRLYRQMPAKRQTAVQQFQEAARNNVGSSSVWQMLGELLAQSNIHGPAQAKLST
jgi:hypothetical protein